MNRPSAPSPLLLSAMLLLASGCGMQAAPHAEEPGAPGEGSRHQDPLTKLEYELQENEQRLYGSIRAQEPTAGYATPPPASPPPPPEQAAPVPASPEAPAIKADEALEASEAPPRRKEKRTSTLSPCEEACRALASMDRAATRICHLTGEGAPRCTQARGRVEAAREQVAAAGCGCGAR